MYHSFLIHSSADGHLGCKRHRCIEQTFGLYGRRREWDDLREQHRNMYIIKGETDHQSRLDP